MNGRGHGSFFDVSDVIDGRSPDRLDAAPDVSMAEIRGVDDDAPDDMAFFGAAVDVWTCVVDAADAFDDRACVCDVAAAFDDRFDDTMASQMYDRTCVLLEPECICNLT